MVVKGLGADAQGGGGALLLEFLPVIILSFGFRLFEQRRLIAAHAPEVQRAPLALAHQLAP